MKTLTLTRTIAAVGTAAALAWGGQAYAIEGGSSDPHLPGVTSGVPAGALPPPGFYFANTLAYNDVTVNNNSGNPLPVNATAWIEIPAIIWSTPLHILGAQYAVAFAQPLVTLSVTTPGGTQGRTGLFNSIITPAIVSWHLPMGFFVSGSLPIYLDTGDTGDRGNGAGTNQHIANNTTTFAPSAAVSWFNGHGLELSLNGEYDIQTQDTNFAPATKFQSGDLLNLDFSAIQVLPGAYKKWSVGAVGYYSVQTNDDQITVAGATSTVPNNRFEKFGLGPSVGYEFGPVAMRLWYIRDLFAKNSGQGDTFFFALGIPL
jgi:hypothetical protein